MPDKIIPKRTASRQREEQYDAKYAVDLATVTVDENIFLFVPNLIGYTRVLLAASSLFFMSYHPKACTVLYCISCLLDAFDGMAARALGQTSKFGAVLDMVTDRCTTACLLCFLSSAYPKYALGFQFLITLDFSSHYIHMYSSLVTGSTSHKTVTSDVSRILWYYYNDATTLFLFCAANEIFFVCLYLNAFYTTPLFTPSSATSNYITAAVTQPFIVDLALRYPTVAKLIVRAFRGVTWPMLLAVVTGPVCAAKQFINVVQFWKASKILCGVDIAERHAARVAAKEKELGVGKAA